MVIANLLSLYPALLPKEGLQGALGTYGALKVHACKQKVGVMPISLHAQDASPCTVRATLTQSLWGPLQYRLNRLSYGHMTASMQGLVRPMQANVSVQALYWLQRTPITVLGKVFRAKGPMLLKVERLSRSRVKYVTS